MDGLENATLGKEARDFCEWKLTDKDREILGNKEWLLKKSKVIAEAAYDRAGREGEFRSTPEQIQDNKEHAKMVSDLGLEIAQEAGMSATETTIVQMLGYLHDVRKIDPDTKPADRLLNHAQWSAEFARNAVRTLGLSDEFAEQSYRAILAHQGMPFVEGALESARAGKSSSAIPTDGVTEKGFVKPYDRISAALYGADLATVADLGAGGFGKLVRINLGFGKSFEDAFASAEKTVNDNVARLQNPPDLVVRDGAPLVERKAGEYLARKREDVTRLKGVVVNKGGFDKFKNMEDYFGLVQESRLVK